MLTPICKNLVCSRRLLHVSHPFKTENIKVTYELPELLKKLDENSMNRLSYIANSMESKIDGLKGEMKGELSGLKGEISGLGHKVAVYAAIVGTVIGIILKTVYDLTTKVHANIEKVQ